MQGFQISHLAVGNLDAFVGDGLVEFGGDVRPVRIVVPAIRLTMTLWLVSGWPRQFIEISLKN